MCPCNGSRINSNYERQLWMPVANCGPQSLTSNSATHCYVEQANHSVTTHLSKRIGTSHSLPRTRHNRELILGGKYSPWLRMMDASGEPWTPKSHRHLRRPPLWQACSPCDHDPSIKMDWHYPHCITFPTQQWADFVWSGKMFHYFMYSMPVANRGI